MKKTILSQLELDEKLFSGHSACPGCAAVLTVRHIARTLGEDTVLVITASCWSVIAGAGPLRALDISVVHCPFPSGAAVASGLKKGLQRLGSPETRVVLLAGDGGTFDIGLQGLSGAAERNEDIIFICYDNEAYMNTGMQRSSATPYASYSTTTPAPLVNKNPKKDIVHIMAAHHVPYIATATIAYPSDLVAKIKKAMEIRGFRFFHIFSPCPPGWGSESHKSIELSRLAVETRLFPLMEVIGGREVLLNYLPEKYIPVEDYLRLQGRFSSLEPGHVMMIQENLERNWDYLQRASKRYRYENEYWS